MTNIVLSSSSTTTSVFVEGDHAWPGDGEVFPEESTFELNCEGLSRVYLAEGWRNSSTVVGKGG